MNIALRWGTFFSLGCLLVLTSIDNAHGQQAKGSNVKSLTYGPVGSTNVTGRFYQSGQGKWIEENADGKFSFKETQRDEWSVCLAKSDGAQLQLNLHTKQVSFLHGQPLYTIISSSTVSDRGPVDGRSVKWLSYTGPNGGAVTGKFYQTAAGQWTEENSSGKYKFTETLRDQWSVHLQKSDGAQVQLDLHSKDITLNGSQKIYKISVAKTTIPTSAPATKNYQISVHTGTASGAGTDSNIDITIFGERGQTKAMRLNPMISGNAFENGDVDRVQLTGLKDVGRVTKVKIVSDGTYPGASWFLAHVTVDGKVARFDRWIDRETVEAPVQ